MKQSILSRTVTTFSNAKRTFFFCIFLAFATLNASAERTIYSPICQSNAYGWSIEKITLGATSTLVDVRVKQSAKYSFFINSQTYIEDPTGSFSLKYRIKRFINNQLDKTY